MREAHEIDGGQPTMEPVLHLDMFGKQYPVAHGGGVWCGANNANNGVILAIGHPQFAFGFFMGLQPDQARQVAAWLTGAADAVDGGRGEQ